MRNPPRRSTSQCSAPGFGCIGKKTKQKREGEVRPRAVRDPRDEPAVLQEEACAAAAREHLLLGQVWRRGNRALGGRAHPVRPRRTAAVTTAWAAGIGGHLEESCRRSRRNDGPSSRPRQPSAAVSPRDRVVRGPGLLKLLPRRGAFAHAAMMRPPARHALRHRHTRKAEQSAPPHLSQTGWGKRGSEDSVGRMNHSRWRRRAHPNQQWVQA